jgi:electron transport complex protein RnfC
MPIMQLIEKAGGLPEDTGKVISGGPMMGKAMTQLDSSVVKGCSGILIMREDESRRGEMTDCIRCSKCLQACPMGLDPTRLMSLSQRGMFEEMEGERTMDCIECGSCSFICPAHRTLLDYIRLGKGKVGAIIRARAAANAPKK